MKKRSKSLVLLILIVIIAIGVLQTKVLAADSNLLAIKENENQYLIYVNNMLNKDFSFAFSNTKEAADLNYIIAGKDTQNNYVAYVDEKLKNQFFNSEETYMWVKTKEDKVILNGERINLNSAKTVEELNKIENITKNITINGTAEQEKIKVNGNQGETYYYQFAKINSSEKYSRLLNLVNEISKYNENTNMFIRLQNHDEVYELYNSLVASLDSKNWVKAENLEITKPYDAKENEQYVLWLKDGKENVDIQFLTAYEKDISKVSQVETEKENGVLPYTYDEATILFVALGIVVIAIIAIVVFKVTTVKKRKD